MKKFLTPSIIVILFLGIFIPSGIIHASVWDTISPSNWIIQIVTAVTGLIMTMMSWVLWLSGTLLNFILDQTIVKMSANLVSMTGINAAWKVIRDFINISFIFILVYQGILIILSRRDKDTAKSVISGIVITALLINFSMFFTKIIIDASNIVTIGFYQNIYDAGQSTTINGQTISRGASGAFMNAMHLSSIFDKDAAVQAISNTQSSAVIINLGASILFLVLAFVFFAVSAMFVVRYVVLIFLLMFSPLGFVGFGLPQLGGLQKQWWDTLLGQCTFAPVYMFLTWVILTLLGSGGFISNSSGYTFAGINDPTKQQGATALILNFTVIIILMIMSLTEAKKRASQGSGYISQATSKLTAFAGGAVMGAGAVAGRNTLGRLASRAERSEKFQELAGKSSIVKAALNTTRKVSNSTFDARNTSPVKKVTDSLKLDIGSGTKSTFGSVLKESTQKKVDFAKSLDRSKVGRESYAKGLAGEGILSRLYVKGGSKPNNVRSMFGSLGRSNRLAAASILGDRVKELSGEHNTLRNEMSQLLNAQSRRTLTATEQDRLDQIQGNGIYAPGLTPGGPLGGLIQKAQDEITTLKADIASQGLNSTQKQQY